MSTDEPTRPTRELVAKFRQRETEERLRAEAEQRLVDEFVPTPRPSLIARAVQAILGPPPVDDPVHGRRANIIATVRKDLGLDRPTQAPADTDGATKSSHGQQ